MSTRVAVVTGAARGIGRAITVALPTLTTTFNTAFTTIQWTILVYDLVLIGLIITMGRMVNFANQVADKLSKEKIAALDLAARDRPRHLGRVVRVAHDLGRAAPHVLGGDALLRQKFQDVLSQVVPAVIVADEDRLSVHEALRAE